MLLMILECVPQRLRGELSRWLIEPKAGVFVGRVPATVREILWDKAVNGSGEGSIVQIWTTNNEQGFKIRSHGQGSRELIDHEGLTLVRFVQ